MGGPGDDADDAANNAKLLRALRDVAPAARTARFRCVIALLRNADDAMPMIVSGTWDGVILDAPRGANGFGYDPLFLPAGMDRTSAELEKDEKNRLSHRGKALSNLVAAVLDGT